nr:oligosaccharide flippase family protein [uncultured Acetatifactor sp.]
MRRNENGFLNHLFKIGIGTVITVLIGLLTTPIITRIIEPSSYGQLSIFQMYTNISVMVLCLGLDQAFVRFFYDHDDIGYKRELFRFCFLTSLSVTIFFCGIFVICNWFFKLKFEFDFFITILLAINIIGSLLNNFALLVLRVTYQSSTYSVCNILYKLSNVLTVIILVKFILKNDTYSLCIGVTTGFIISTFYAIAKSRQYWKFGTTEKKINKISIIKYGLPFIFSMGITQLFEALDKISLNYYCAYSDVGIYASAMSIVNIFTIIQTAFNAVWGPRQVEEYVNSPEDTTFIQTGNQIITAAMFFGGLSLIFAKDFFALLLGPKFREAAPILPFLVFNPIMYTISETTCSGIGISKKSYLNIMVGLGACIVNFLGNMILVPVIGTKGAAISTGISYFVFWALRTFFSNKYYYIEYKIYKFIVITFITMAYAGYNTFFDNFLISFLGYLGAISLLFFLYKDTILISIKLTKSFIMKGSHKLG